MILLDLLFPKFCIVCKRFGNYICDDCRKDIEFLERYICPICNEQSYPLLVHSQCKEKSPIDGVISFMRYNKTAKKIVKAIKYQLIYDIYTELSTIIFRQELFNEFSVNYKNCYLQPIPLHPKRLKIRGFNQAEELSKLFSNKFQYPVIDLLTRVKDTKPQAQIHYKKQRQENIKDAFIVKEKNLVKGKTIILVDDVYTSGSTCLEAAKTLRNAGTVKVFVWSLARD